MQNGPLLCTGACDRRVGANSRYQLLKKVIMKNTNRFVYFLQEIAIVVIGVLIAVSINNYKENTDNEQYIKKTLLAIENEIRQSQSSVDTVLKRHLRIVEAIQTDTSEEELYLGEYIAGLGGVQVPTIKNVGLRFYISNKAELVDYSIISQLLEIEHTTEVLSEQINRLANFSIENITDESQKSKLTFTYLLTDVIDSEKALLEYYAKFLNDHESYLRQEEERQ